MRIQFSEYSSVYYSSPRAMFLTIIYLSLSSPFLPLLLRNLESSRDYSATLNFEGVDENDGTCGAAIEALVLICGDQDDSFYYGEPGTCMDFPELYKQIYGTDAAPEVVYVNRKNFTHPFSSTCDIEISCGVEKEDTIETTMESGGKDTSASSSAGRLVFFSGYRYLVSSLAIFAVIYMV